MKYLINRMVVNANRIICVEYYPASEDVLSRTVITVQAYSDEWDGTIELTGEQADRFWAVYSADALDVMEGEAA